jgi:hypothetical protein
MSEPFERSPDSDQFVGPSKEDRAREMVRKFVKKSEDYRRPHLDLARKNRELYNVWDAQAKSQIGRANLKLPYAYSIIETETPQITEMFLRETPFVKFQGTEPQDMIWETVLTDFHAQQVDAMKFTPKFISFVKGMQIDGTAVAKVPYKFKEKLVTKRVQKMDEVLGIPVPSKQIERVVDFDQCDFENIPLHDFFPDWSTREPGDIDNQRGSVHRMWKTQAELKSNRRRKTPAGYTVGVYTNLDELKTSLSVKGTKAWSDPYWSESFDSANSNDSKVKDSEKLEVWEYWGLFDPNGDGQFEEYIITVANGDVVIRCEPNFYDFKFRPFVACPGVVRDGEWYGISELSAVRGLIKEATALRNARLDQTNLAVNRMFLIDRSAGIKAKNLYMRPNGIIWTNDMQGIKALEIPEVPASSYKEIQDLQNEIQTTTGSSSGPQLSEAGRVFGRSATGAQFVQSFAASRVGLKGRLLGDLLFKRMYRIMFMTNRQFVTDAKWVRVSDPNAATENPFAVLPLDAFHCNYDFTFTTNLDTGGSEQRFQKLQTLAGLLQTAEGTQPGITKWDILIESLAEELVGRKTKKFMRNPQELAQMQFQKLAMEQAANAQAGARAPQTNKQAGAA